jgi:Tfp pilus assembly protein PilV
MKTPQPSTCRTLRGFTLLENMLALALVASTALPILGLISIGLTDAKQAGDHRLTANLRNTVQQMLADPTWPSEAQPEGAWAAERCFDHVGRMLPEERRAEASMILKMHNIPAPGYASDWLETVEAVFFNQDSAVPVARTLVQRRKFPAQS